jgi:hypothetical protein
MSQGYFQLLSNTTSINILGACYMSRFGFWIHTIRLLLRGSKVITKDGRYIVIDFYEQGDCYMAAASTKEYTVWNCYGSTKEQAQEMALFKLKHAMEEEKELFVKGDGYTLYREK